LIADWYPTDGGRTAGVQETFALAGALPAGSRLLDFGCGPTPHSDRSGVRRQQTPWMALRGAPLTGMAFTSFLRFVYLMIFNFDSQIAHVGMGKSNARLNRANTIEAGCDPDRRASEEENPQ
jgi:hypothetical protein